MEDLYFWKKNSGPSVDKDRIRSSLAEYCLSHLKTHATIIKANFFPEEIKSYSVKQCDDFDSNIFYSLNKNRRWEAEDSIGAELLNDLQKLNPGWIVMFEERVTSRTGSSEVYFYGPRAHNFEDFYPIKKIHYLNGNDEYIQKSVNSFLGQSYHNYLSKDQDEEDPEPTRPVASYIILRAPRNYLVFFKKSFQGSNYWGHNWPRAGYWNRLNRGKDRSIDLRYEVFEDLDVDLEEEVEGEVEEELTIGSRPKFYNLEDHIVDEFVVVKRKKRVSS